MSKDGDQSDLGPRFKCVVFEYLHRIESEGLSHPEYRVMMFIFDRTIMWNKAEENIPFRHFIDGQKNIGVGTDLHPKTLTLALDRLEELGIIVREKAKEYDTRSNRYALSDDVIDRCIEHFENKTPVTTDLRD